MGSHLFLRKRISRPSRTRSRKAPTTAPATTPAGEVWEPPEPGPHLLVAAAPLTQTAAEAQKGKRQVPEGKDRHWGEPASPPPPPPRPTLTAPQETLDSVWSHTGVGVPWHLVREARDAVQLKWVVGRYMNYISMKLL